MISNTSTIYAGECLNGLDQIISSTYQYIEQFEHIDSPEHTKYIMESDYDADMIGFIFQEKFEMLNQKFINSIKLIDKLVCRYMQQIHDEITNLDKDKAVDISQDAFEHYQKMITSIGYTSMYVSEPKRTEQQIRDLKQLPRWFVDELNKMHSDTSFTHRTVISVDMLHTIVDILQYDVMSAIQQLIDKCRVVSFSYEAFLYFKRSIQVTIYAVTLLQSIQIA